MQINPVLNSKKNHFKDKVLILYRNEIYLSVGEFQRKPITLACESKLIVADNNMQKKGNEIKSHQFLKVI